MANRQLIFFFRLHETSRFNITVLWLNLLHWNFFYKYLKFEKRRFDKKKNLFFRRIVIKMWLDTIRLILSRSKIRRGFFNITTVIKSIGDFTIRPFRRLIFSWYKVRIISLRVCFSFHLNSSFVHKSILN